MQKTFKVTTRWDSYTHYFVDAVNEEEVYEIVTINGHPYEENNNE